MAAAVLHVALDRAGWPLAQEPKHSRVYRDGQGRLRYRSSALELRLLPPAQLGADRSAAERLVFAARWCDRALAGAVHDSGSPGLSLLRERRG